MILELVLTLIMLIVNFFTSIVLPFGLSLVSEGMADSLDGFISFFPSLPFLPYKAISVSFGVVLTVILSTVLYKIVRALISYFIK